LNQLFGFAYFCLDDANVHDRDAGVAVGMAVDAVLTDQDQGVGQQIERDGKLQYVTFEME